MKPGENTWILFLQNFTLWKIKLNFYSSLMSHILQNEVVTLSTIVT